MDCVRVTPISLHARADHRDVMDFVRFTRKVRIGVFHGSKKPLSSSLEMQLHTGGDGARALQCIV
jgi:hypothetical protein